MRTITAIRLLIIFVFTFSLGSLPGPLSAALYHLPTIPLARANPAPIEAWYPAGPSMNTELVSIFTDATSEITGLLSKQIDLTDSPLPPSLINCFSAGTGCPSGVNPADFFVTSPIAGHNYFELEFMLANNFWGCNFSFGNSACGVNFRQGIAHTVDKNIFTTAQANIAGHATAIDNPVPPSNGGLPSANPCGWDPLFPKSSANCVVGAPGGTAYHLATATGVNYPWQPPLGSPDFCAAATHFIAAFNSTGVLGVTKNQTTCMLNPPPGGWPLSVTSHTVSFFIRSDSTARLDLGNSLSQEICALFTGVFTTGCSPFLTIAAGTIAAFCGFTTSKTGIFLCWGMYTAGFGNIFPFDSSLYFGYNSKFVSGGTWDIPPCDPSAVPTSFASNYMYLCNPTFDSFSNQMEFAPCLSASGDPAPGQTTPTFGTCPGTTQLSAISAGYKAEDAFGKGAYTIPVWTGLEQFGYLSNWSRVINDEGVGIPNYFTWLNAYTATPAVTGTFRQGFAQGVQPSGLSPYTAVTTWEFYILRNIYDSLGVTNPLSSGQLINWMAVSSTNHIPTSQLMYPPPPGTVDTFRFSLRNDLFWQDGRPVTSFDAAFSYLSLLANSAFQAVGVVPLAGITILSPRQFDINLKAEGIFTLIPLTSLTIIPGRYWTGVGAAAWDSAVSACTAPNAACYPAQYTLGTASSGPPPVVCTLTCVFQAANMNADPTKVSSTFDPIAAGILIGSGPWECKSSTGVVGTGCVGIACPPGPCPSSYALTRFGLGVPPGSSPSGSYFRSSGTLALYIWTGNTGAFSADFVNFSQVAFCFLKPPGTPGCTHWQVGIGNPNGPASIGALQVSEVARFVGVNWVNPFSWTQLAGIGTFPPILYEGSAVLSPAQVSGCAQLYPVGGYDC